MTVSPSLRRGAAALALATVAIAGLSACAPLIVGGAVVGGSLLYTDRRTSGTQIEDQAIELKAARRLEEQFGDRGHFNVTSYNRLVLVTGEVATEADRAQIEQTVMRVDNVRSVVNEVGVLGISSLSSRSNDVLLTTKVKAALVDAKDLMANAFKVVAERGTVYLMGRVTEREAARSAEVARSVGGVQKVVRVFELISEAELADLVPKTPPKN
jgi:osmotically-inducible protein OsmY